MTNKVYMAAICAVMFPLSALAGEAQATLKLKVVDEDGKPVPNAEMTVVFSGPNWELDNEVTAKTDAEGLLVAKGWSKDVCLDDIEVFSETAGYYTSSKKLPLMIAADEPGKREFELTLLTRKVGKPIPMYAKRVLMQLPDVRKEIGFDFEKADWVKPYGKGEVADCTFIGTKSYENRNNNTTSVVMAFPGKKSGLLLDPAQKNIEMKTSDFKTSRTAPEEGYEGARDFIAKKTFNEGYRGTTKEASYIFRSRTKLGKDGVIESCHYGKLIDAVDVQYGAGKPDTKPYVKFTYYFNPTPNDRNLEFDTKKNLFGELDWEHAVREP